MTHTASHSVPEQGKFRRAFAAFWAFLEALESGSLGYTFDRIERLEREVRRLQEELRQSRGSGAVDAHNASAAVPPPEANSHDAASHNGKQSED